MSNDTDHTNQPSDDFESYYDDLDDGAGCVEIWEHIDDRRDD